MRSFRNLKLFLQIIVLIILLLNLILFINSNIPPRSIKGKAEEGIPYLFKDTPEYLCDFSEYAVCGNYLYVLFDSKNILACYDLEGTYCHSYLLSMSNNGQAHLYADNDTLYLESREHTFYIFEEGKLADYIKMDISLVDSYRKGINTRDAHLGIDGSMYVRCGASIWRTNLDRSEEILHRSPYLVYFRGPTQLVIFLICIFFLVFLAKFP